MERVLGWIWRGKEIKPGSLNPAPPPHSPCPQMPRPHNFYFKKQEWQPHHFPFPMPDNNFGEEIFPNISLNNYSASRGTAWEKLDAVSYRPYNSINKLFLLVIHIFHQEWVQRFCSVFQKIFSLPGCTSDLTLFCHFVEMHCNPFSFSMNGSTPVFTATPSKRFKFPKRKGKREHHLGWLVWKGLCHCCHPQPAILHWALTLWITAEALASSPCSLFFPLRLE